MNYFNNYTPEDFINDGYKKIGNRYYKVEGNILAIGRDDDWVSKHNPALKTDYYTIKNGELEIAGAGSIYGVPADERTALMLLEFMSDILKDVE